MDDPSHIPHSAHSLWAASLQQPCSLARRHDCLQEKNLDTENTDPSSVTLSPLNLLNFTVERTKAFTVTCAAGGDAECEPYRLCWCLRFRTVQHCWGRTATGGRWRGRSSLLWWTPPETAYLKKHTTRAREQKRQDVLVIYSTARKLVNSLEFVLFLHKCDLKCGQIFSEVLDYR